MNGDPRQKPSGTAIMAGAALLISIGSGVYYQGGQARTVSSNVERITKLDAELVLYRDLRDEWTRKLATMEAQIAVLMQDRERDRK